MIARWSAGAKRLAALEADVAALRTALAEAQAQVVHLAERAGDADAATTALRERMEERLDPLEGRIETLHRQAEQMEHLQQDLQRIGQAVETLDDQGARSQADAEGLARAVNQAERRIEIHVGEMDTALRALIERVEQVRLSSAGTKERSDSGHDY